MAVRLMPNGAVPLDRRRAHRHQFAVDPTAAEIEAYREEIEQLGRLRRGAVVPPGETEGGALVAAAAEAGAAAVPPAARRRRREAAPAEGLDGALGRWCCRELRTVAPLLGAPLPGDL